MWLDLMTSAVVMYSIVKSSLSLTIAVFESFWVLDGNFASNVSTTRRNKSTFKRRKACRVYENVVEI